MYTYTDMHIHEIRHFLLLIYLFMSNCKAVNQLFPTLGGRMLRRL